MHFPRLPDWAIYSAVVAAVVIAGYSRRENADAPEPLSALPGEAAALLDPQSAFDSVLRVNSGESGPNSGTAFSAGSEGVWLTARHVVENCDHPAIMVADGRGVAARAVLDPTSDIAILLTEGGAQALPLVGGEPLRRGERGFHPGYPLGHPGEAASRLLGRETLPARERGGVAQPVLAWAESGRTEGVSGPLSGLSGAPVLDEAGRVVGVTIAQSPRRGRIYTTTPQAVTQALVSAGQRTSRRGATGQPIDIGNYYRVADELRRELRVVQVLCAEA